LGVLLGRSVVVLGGVAATADGPEDGEAGDRYPGRTLVTVQDDTSRNFRTVEVDADGEVVWRHDLSAKRGIVYVDRLGPDGKLPEEPATVPAGDQRNGTSHGGLGGLVATGDPWIGFVLPRWVGIAGLLAILVGPGALVGLGWEWYRYGRTA
jgi:hypothetical protein